MWYVMQVYTGREDPMTLICKRRIDSEILNDCFCPKYQTTFKKKGERTTVTKVLFPGYIFLDTENIEAVSEQLRQIPEFTKVLKVGEDIVPLTEEEKSFIKRHGNAEHIFEISKGYMVGDQIVIEEGAFKGYEGKLKHVDRHNRYGIMEIEFFGRMQEIKFGLEVVRKV